MIDAALTDVLRRRVLASLVDLAIVLGLTALAARIVAVTFRGSTSPEGFRFDGGLADYQRFQELREGFYRLQIFGDTWYVWDLGRLALLSALAVLLILMIWVVLPSRTDQTPGKALFGLRVTDLLGETAAGSQHVTRTIFGIVDILPVVLPGLLGWILALSAGHRQRIGDRLAQTVVIDAKVPSTRAASRSTVAAEDDEQRTTRPTARRASVQRPSEQLASGGLTGAETADTETADSRTPEAEPLDRDAPTPPAEVAPAPVPDSGAEPDAAPIGEPAPVLFDDNAPIDIERPANDLPRRRTLAEATGGAERTPPPGATPGSTVPAGLLAADNGAELLVAADEHDLVDDGVGSEELRPVIEQHPSRMDRRSTDGTIPGNVEPAVVEPRETQSLEAQAREAQSLEAQPEETEPEDDVPEPSGMDRMENAAWERPIAEVAPVWRPPATPERPLVHEQPGEERGALVDDRSGTAGAVPEPVDLDFDDDSISADSFLADAVEDSVPGAGEERQTVLNPATTESTDGTGAPEGPVEASAADPRTPRWSDDWQAWVVFDPARNAWLRHDTEQDLWLEI